VKESAVNEPVTSPAANVQPQGLQQHDVLPAETASGLFFQAKLSVGAPDDPLEKEADDTADHVMRMPESSFIQQKSAQSDEGDKINRKEIVPTSPLIQRDGENADSPQPQAAPPAQLPFHLINPADLQLRVPSLPRISLFPTRLPSTGVTTLSMSDSTATAAPANAIDWFAMNRPFWNRGAGQISAGDYSAIETHWNYSFQFFRSIGASAGHATFFSNLLVPMAIDSSLQRDHPTWWETTDRELGTSSKIISPTLLRFDLDNLFGTIRPIWDPSNPYQIQKKSEAAAPGFASETTTNQINGSKNSGSPMPAHTQSFMESRFGYDFSDVKIHSGGDAANMAGDLNAKAFTVGNNIYFNRGNFSPDTSEGKQLLAHELTHTLQQGGSTVKKKPVQENNLTGIAPHHVESFIQRKFNQAKPARAESESIPENDFLKKTLSDKNVTGLQSSAPPNESSLKSTIASANTLVQMKDSPGGEIQKNVMRKPEIGGNNTFVGQETFSSVQNKTRFAKPEPVNAIPYNSSPNQHIQRQLQRGDPLDDSFIPIVSDATSLSGVLADAVTALQSRKGHAIQSIFIFTQRGLQVFDITGNRNIQKYAQRAGEPMFPEGMWLLEGVALSMMGFRGTDSDELLFEPRGFGDESLNAFSAERKKTILKRKDHRVLLSDFVEFEEKDYKTLNLLPALVISKMLPKTAGVADGIPEAWSEGKYKDVKKLFGSGKTDPSIPANDRDPQKDKATPDKLVLWEREDGKQFINVHVTDKIISDGEKSQEKTTSVAIEVTETDSPEKLKEKIEDATKKMRDKLQDEAVKEEQRVTKGSIQYNDSTFLGGESTDGPKPNLPAYRADISGPDTMVRDGEGNYRMRLHYEDISGILLNQVLEAYGGAEYTWQIIDITALHQQIVNEKIAQIDQNLKVGPGGQIKPAEATKGDKELDKIKRKDKVGEHDTVTKTDEVTRDARRRYENFSEDNATAWEDLTSPLASQDGSSEAAVRSVLVNTFNLTTAPLSAIFSLGGWLVSSIASFFDLSDEVDKNIPFPNHDGYFMVRCVAQPRPKGSDDHPRVRMPSVAIRIVEIKEIQKQTGDELKSQNTNLQAVIVELLLNYQNTTDATQLKALKEQLEVKVQEAAQSNSSFLNDQIASLEKLGQEEARPKDQKDRIAELLIILKQGISPGAGLISAIIEKQIVIKKQELELAKKSGDPIKIREVKDELEQLERRGETAQLREAEMGQGSANPIIRPQAVFVNEEDGRTIPLLIEVAADPEKHTTRGYTMRLSDVGTAEGDTYSAIGPSKEKALLNVLKEYAGHFPYGRGYISVQMPASSPYGVTQPVIIRCNPHDTAQASEKLDQLLKVLAIVGIFVPVVGQAVMAVAVASAAYKMLYRVNNHTFAWDTGTVLDVLTIIGGVASGISGIAGSRLVIAKNLFAVVPESEEMATWVSRLSKFVKVIDFVESAANNVSYMIGSMESVQKYLSIQRDELSGKISHSEARFQRANMMVAAMNDQFMQHAPGVIGHFLPNGKHVEEQSTSPTKTTPEKLPHEQQGTPGGGHEQKVPVSHHAEPVFTGNNIGEMLGNAPGLSGVKAVPISRPSELTGNETRVKFENGHVVLELGPKANDTNIRQHIDTIKMLQRYEGTLGYIRQLLSKVGQLIGMGPAFGTRAHEVSLELTKLTKIKAELEGLALSIQAQMEQTSSVSDLSKLVKEYSSLHDQITSIDSQARAHEQDINSTEKGKGYVAMADTTATADYAHGLRPGHDRETNLKTEKKALGENIKTLKEQLGRKQEKLEKLEKLQKQREDYAKELLGQPEPSKARKDALEKLLRKTKADIIEEIGEQYEYNKPEDLTDPIEDLNLDLKNLSDRIDHANSRVRNIDVELDPKHYRAPLTCFSKGTQVHTSTGLKNIESIQIDDEVYSLDLPTNVLKMNKVTHLHRNKTTHFYNINADGEKVAATGEHPFYDPHKQIWVSAKSLAKGSILLSKNLRQIIVDEVQYMETPEVETYNLSIENIPNYFVGSGLLVHNVEPVLTLQGAIDVQLGGSHIVYIGVNPLYEGKVYVGRTEVGDTGRQTQHRTQAKNFLTLYERLNQLVKTEGTGHSANKQAVYDQLMQAIKRKPRAYSPNEFESLTKIDKPFFDFMQHIELKPIVIGLRTEEQASYLEQININIENKLEHEVMNRREESVTSLGELESTVRSQLAGTYYCP
jgi:hypothetical protein